MRRKETRHRAGRGEERRIERKRESREERRERVERVF